MGGGLKRIVSLKGFDKLADRSLRILPILGYPAIERQLLQICSLLHSQPEDASI
jgi:hypothetical protein